MAASETGEQNLCGTIDERREMSPGNDLKGGHVVVRQ